MNMQTVPTRRAQNRVEQAVLSRDRRLLTGHHSALTVRLWDACSQLSSALGNRYKGEKKESNKKDKKRVRNADGKGQVLHRKGRSCYQTRTNKVLEKI